MRSEMGARFAGATVHVLMLPRGPAEFLPLETDRCLRESRLWIVDPAVRELDCFRLFAAELQPEMLDTDGILAIDDSFVLRRIAEASRAGRPIAVLLHDADHGPTLASMIVDRLERCGGRTRWIPCPPSHQIAEALQGRPLSGQCVLVTRPRQQARELCRLLWRSGATVEIQPAIEILPATDLAAVDRVVAQLHAYDWLVFSSANGVEHLIARLFATGRDLRALGHARVAAIGPGTADALRAVGVVADLMPDVYRAEALADAMLPFAAGKRVLLARASRGREVLAERLVAAGARVEQVVVYQSQDVRQLNPRIDGQLEAGRIDWVTVTSSAIARAVVSLVGPALRKTRLAAISPITADALRREGFEPAAIAETYDMRGLVRAIETCRAMEK